MAEVKVVVLGAGVIGLTSAALLSEKPGYSVTVVAKSMPGDYDIEYASPWAGANYLPTGARGTPLQQFEADTWPHFDRLAKDIPGAGVHYQETVLWQRDKDATGAFGVWQKELMSDNPWYKDIVPDFRVLAKDELPAGVDSGTSFTSVCINTALYLPWLASQALENGATFQRGIVSHVNEAAQMHSSGSPADVVINATGLGSRTLEGVADSSVVPARGQIVLVRNDPGIMSAISGFDNTPNDESLYIMSGGTILGGCYQKGSWESQPDPNMSIRIMQRAIALCPKLTDGKGIEALSIIRHGVGLRPVRDAGPRVERDIVDGQKVVHAYGHGGGGYQSSWGTAEEVERLVVASVSG